MRVHDPSRVITILTFFQKVTIGSRTHTSPVPWTARGCPSAPLMIISLLGLTSIPKMFACHKGISETDAPVSKRTLVGGIVCETDLGGTFFETSKSYEGIELFSEDADMLYSVRYMCL